MKNLSTLAIGLICLTATLNANFTTYECHSNCEEGFCNGPGEAGCVKCKGNRISDFGVCVCKPSYFGTNCDIFLDLCQESSMVNGVWVCTKCWSPSM